MRVLLKIQEEGQLFAAGPFDFQALNSTLQHEAAIRLKIYPFWVSTEVPVTIQGLFFLKCRFRRSLSFSFPLAVVALATLCDASYAEQIFTDSQPTGHPAEQISELATVSFTAPDQQVFTVQLTMQVFGYIRNNDTGEEFHFLLIPGDNPGNNEDLNPQIDSHTQRYQYSLELYNSINTKSGPVVKLLARVDGLQLASEYLEPTTGYLFKLLETQKAALPPAPGEYSRASSGCCISCDSHIVCGIVVRACGLICNKDIPFASQLDSSFPSADIHLAGQLN